MPHRPPAASAGSARSHALRFPELDRLIVAHPGETIFQCARRSGLRIVGACGGRGACGTCSVRIAEGVVEHVDGRPLQPRAAKSGDRARWVRSCQVLPRTDCTVDVEQRSLAPIVRAEIDAGESGETLPFDPVVIGFDIAVPPPTLRDPQSDADRVIRASPVPITAIDLAAARELPGLLRAFDWSVRMHLREGEAIAFAPAAGPPALGLAVDLGTTNVAGFLIDLSTGARVASLGIENPQVAWGADVISRINYAIRDAGAAEELRAAAVAAINALAHDLCRAVGSRATDILDVTVCGNTAMHHLLLGLPVRQLGRAPFVAALREAIDVKARDLGVAIAPGAYLHLAPNVGGFVGGDHVTALLATEPLWASAAAALVMDIGTNTEMSLIHRGEIVTASCPSGPALEGGHISCGMRAAEGAIERVAIAHGRDRDRSDRRQEAGGRVRLGRARHGCGVAQRRPARRRRPACRSTPGHSRTQGQAGGRARPRRAFHAGTTSARCNSPKRRSAPASSSCCALRASTRARSNASSSPGRSAAISTCGARLPSGCSQPCRRNASRRSETPRASACARC